MSKKKEPKKKVVKRESVDRPYNMGTMSEAEYFSKIRSSLRRGFMYWLPMYAALKKASRPSENKENLRLKTEYQCAECLNWYKKADIHIDHIIEAGSLRTWEDIVPFIKRLTAPNPEDFQVLCKDVCHRKKTKLDRDSKKKEELFCEKIKNNENTNLH